jgi:hypothetical protein
LPPVLRRAIRGAHSRTGSKPATPLPRTASGTKKKGEKGPPEKYLDNLHSKNLVQTGGSIGESAFECQAQTGTPCCCIADRRGNRYFAFPAFSGSGKKERVDLSRAGGFWRQKRAKITLHAASRFRAQMRRSIWYCGSV